MPLQCARCAAGFRYGDVFCSGCGAAYAADPPRSAGSDPGILDQFDSVRVHRIRKVTRRALSVMDQYALYVTSDMLVLIRTGEYLAGKAAWKDFKSMTLTIFGSAVSDYFLNKEDMSSNHRDVTPRNPDGSLAGPDRAFKSDVVHNRSIPSTAVVSLDSRTDRNKKGDQWIFATIVYRDETGSTEALGISLSVSRLGQYEPERFARVVTRLGLSQIGAALGPKLASPKGPDPAKARCARTDPGTLRPFTPAVPSALFAPPRSLKF
jgi:hypothetical protein